MRTTVDRGRSKQCASFVGDVDGTGVMVECPHCGQHQVSRDEGVGAPKPHLCDNETCRKEIFYPGWAEW